MSRTTIAIDKSVRDRLREFRGYDRTYNQAITELLDAYGKEE